LRDAAGIPHRFECYTYEFINDNCFMQRIQTFARHARRRFAARAVVVSIAWTGGLPRAVGMAGNRFEQVRDGVYVAAREDLRQFVDWHPQFHGAALKRLKSFVHDADRRDKGPAHIICRPAPGTVAWLGGKTRGKCRLDDIIELNALGVAALQRTKRTRREGELFRDSIV
jgi:hypothetical protein